MTIEDLKEILSEWCWQYKLSIPSEALEDLIDQLIAVDSDMGSYGDNDL